MATSKLYNMARMTTATTGTGTITLGSAVASFISFASAGVSNGETIPYAIIDGTAREMGTGVYTSAGTTMTRVLRTSTTGALLNLSGSAQVYITPGTEDFPVGPAGTTTQDGIVRWDSTTGRAIKDTVPFGCSDAGDIYTTTNRPGATTSLNIVNSATAASSQAALYVNSGTAATFSFTCDHSQGATFAYALSGQMFFGTSAANNFNIVSNNAIALIADTSQNVMVGSATADRRFHVEQDSVATNTVTYLQRLTSTSSGTPAAGIGAGIEFEVETAAGNNEVGATIEAVTTDVTSTSEDFDVVTKIMRNGAAASEAHRISTDWPYYTDSLGNKSYVPKNVYLTSQHSVSSTTATEVTGLQATLVAGTYRYDYRLIVQSSTAADGLKFGINYTGTASKIVSMLTWPDTGVTAALGAVDDTAAATTGQIVAHSTSRAETTTAPDMNTGTAGVATQAVNLMVQITGVCVVTDGGDLELWHASESTNATTVEVGSSLQITRVN